MRSDVQYGHPLLQIGPDEASLAKLKLPVKMLSLTKSFTANHQIPSGSRTGKGHWETQSSRPA